MADGNGGMAVFAAGCLPLLLIGGVLGVVTLMSGGSCSPTTGVSVAEGDVPKGPIGKAGWSGEQLVNAAAIITAGAGMDLSARDQTIGVMTAMGESTLEVIDRGDAAGPDSRGLFQQRANGAWGSYKDRMDPVRSAEMFFEKLADIKDRDDMKPTQVAHTVQRNADPYHYEPYWRDAKAVVEALSGVAAEGIPVDAEHCTALGEGGEPQISDDCKPVANGIHPSACRAYAALTAEFGDFWDKRGGVGCWREEHSGDHPVGQACDYMVAPPGQSPSAQAHKDTVAVVQWLMTHHEKLKIKYIIYDEAIWNPDQEDQGPWEEVKDADSQYSLEHFGGNKTLAHIDHIHLSTGPWHHSSGR